jgi:hypothetical protein
MKIVEFPIADKQSSTALSFVTCLLALIFHIFVPNHANAATERMALVIGNSNYLNIGKLQNTKNDATDIQRNLSQIGFKTRLVLDADEVALRRAIKSFASESNDSKIALVYYAGHGAQINGENYLLPTDLEVPKREADIQLSAIKVDDVVNSLKSSVKIIFLDACRDNPALSKSLSKGRGAFRGGLAAAKTSSNDLGSLFIAYATDSGNVALDGEGQKNSPFTSALLKYIKQPISIDDMFSLVTREVRLSTKNAQRPYKYASLEGVVCLTQKCGTVATSTESNFPERTSNPEEQDLAIASSSDDPQIIFNFLNKYPESKEKHALHLKLRALDWGWKDLWVHFEINTAYRAPLYIKPSSIKIIGSRVIYETKIFVEKPDETVKNPPNYYYTKLSTVIDCKEKKSVVYQFSTYDLNEKLISDIQDGDPRFVNLTVDSSSDDPGSLAWTYRTIVCDPQTLTPLLLSSEVNSKKWERLYSVTDGINYFFKSDSLISKDETREFMVKFEFRDPKPLSQTKFVNDQLWNPAFEGYRNLPAVKTIVIKNRFNCKNESFVVLKESYYDPSDRYVFLRNFEINEKSYSKIQASGGLRDLLTRVCTN